MVFNIVSFALLDNGILFLDLFIIFRSYILNKSNKCHNNEDAQNEIGHIHAHIFAHFFPRYRSYKGKFENVVHLRGACF
jgi:hypothetical protein